MTLFHITGDECVFLFWAFVWFVVACCSVIAICGVVMVVAGIIDKMQNPREPSFLLKSFTSSIADAGMPNDRTNGPVNGALVCPHCQSKGQVRTLMVRLKKGVSGGKATAALLTGGVTLLATGLSRKEGATKAFCGSCKSTWTF